MQYFFAIIAICISLTAATSTPTEASLSTPPAPATGQSVGQWIDQIFGDLDDSFTTSGNQSAGTAKRGYSNSGGLHISTWTNDTEKIAYNITVDFSNTCSGLNYSTDIGVYTFTNGTTTNETLLIDMVKDLWSLHATHRRVPNYAGNHTLAIAQLALHEANQALRSGLVCGHDQTTGPVTDFAVAIRRDELRHLLQNRWSYWAAIFLASGIGAMSGAGIAALSDLAFRGRVNDENVVQTAIVVGTATMVGGIFNHIHETGRLDRAEDVANRVHRVNLRASEAVVQNVAMSWGRRQIQRIIRRQVEEAMSDIISTANPASIPDPGTPLDPGNPSDIGIDTPGSTQLGTVDPGIGNSGTGNSGTGNPGTGNSGNFEVCLEMEDATAAALALGDMSSQEFQLRTEAEVAQTLAGRREPDCNV